MRLSFDFHIHLSPGLSQLIERFCKMNERLAKALDDLTSEVADSNGKLDSIKAAVENFPNVVAEAVADALEQAELDADEAASIIDAAREAVSDRVDSVLAAVETNPGGDDTVTTPTEPEPPTGEPGADTTSG